MDKENMKSDILYVGMSYNDSWGYKKARFLNYFVNNKLTIYGNKAWKRWFKFYPALEKYFIENNGLIPIRELNMMYNCSKIIPVDGNPGIFNGIHERILETLSAGVLPLMEWNGDMDFIFKGAYPCTTDSTSPNFPCPACGSSSKRATSSRNAAS